MCGRGRHCACRRQRRGVHLRARSPVGAAGEARALRRAALGIGRGVPGAEGLRRRGDGGWRRRRGRRRRSWWRLLGGRRRRVRPVRPPLGSSWGRRGRGRGRRRARLAWGGSRRGRRRWRRRPAAHRKHRSKWDGWAAAGSAASRVPAGWLAAVPPGLGAPGLAVAGLPPIWRAPAELAACPPGWGSALAGQRPANGASRSHHRRTVAAAASLSPREAARSTKSSRLARCAPQPKLTRFSAQRTRARTLQARSLLATRTQAHVLLARCFRLRRLLSLASRAADFFGLGTPRALAVAGLAWQPAGCWLACGDVALAGCEASAFVRSFWSHSHCARRRLPPVSSSSSTTSLLADHSAEPRSGGDDIVIDGCRGIFFFVAKVVY